MTALRDGLADVNAFAAAHPGVECPTAKRLARLVYETGDEGSGQVEMNCGLWLHAQQLRTWHMAALLQSVM